MKSLKEKFEEVFILLEESLRIGIKWEPEQIERLLNVIKTLVKEREELKAMLRRELALSKIEAREILNG